MLRQRGLSAADDVIEFINRELIPVVRQLQARIQGRWGDTRLLTEADYPDLEYKVQLTDEFLFVDGTLTGTFNVRLPTGGDHTGILTVVRMGTGQTVRLIGETGAGVTVSGSTFADLGNDWRWFRVKAAQRADETWDWTIISQR